MSDHDPASTNENTHEDESSSVIKSSLYLAKKGPPWLRGMALFVACLTAAGPYFNYLKEWLDDRRIDAMIQSTTAVTSPPGPQQTSQNPYTGGTRVAPPNEAAANPPNILDQADAMHLSYHTVTLEERPSFKRIFVANHKEILAYSIYNSDGCMVIKHLKDGHIKTDLVRDEGTKLASNPADIARAAILNVSLEGVFPETSTPSSSSSPSEDDKTHIQAGCINPHPGQFRFWTGPPADQCWGPVFRQFADGCTHYQMFNRCNNTWDPTVHWTYCNPNHRW